MSHKSFVSTQRWPWYLKLPYWSHSISKCRESFSFLRLCSIIFKSSIVIFGNCAKMSRSGHSYLVFSNLCCNMLMICPKVWTDSDIIGQWGNLGQTLCCPPYAAKDLKAFPNCKSNSALFLRHKLENETIKLCISFYQSLMICIFHANWKWNLFVRFLFWKTYSIFPPGHWSEHFFSWSWAYNTDRWFARSLCLFRINW